MATPIGRRRNVGQNSTRKTATPKAMGSENRSARISRDQGAGDGTKAAENARDGVPAGKIGHTVDLSTRFSLYRTRGWDMELLAAFPGSRYNEWQLHRRFAEYRVGRQNGAERGRPPELFTLPDDVLNEIVAEYGKAQIAS